MTPVLERVSLALLPVLAAAVVRGLGATMRIRHVGREGVEALEAAGAHVEFLPPYSPDLNPIEELWSKLKELIRGFAPLSMRAFDRALAFAMSWITSDDIHGWFTHSGYLAQTK